MLIAECINEMSKNKLLCKVLFTLRNYERSSWDGSCTDTDVVMYNIAQELQWLILLYYYLLL